MQEMKLIGAKVAHLRKARGLSCRALAKAANVSKSTVNNWEAGRHLGRLDIAKRLADALGVDVRELWVA